MAAFHFAPLAGFECPLTSWRAEHVSEIHSWLGWKLRVRLTEDVKEILDGWYIQGTVRGEGTALGDPLFERPVQLKQLWIMTFDSRHGAFRRWEFSTWDGGCTEYVGQWDGASQTLALHIVEKNVKLRATPIRFLGENVFEMSSGADKIKFIRLSGAVKSP
jgi:hypothetical protein